MQLIQLFSLLRSEFSGFFIVWFFVNLLSLMHWFRFADEGLISLRITNSALSGISIQQSYIHLASGSIVPKYYFNRKNHEAALSIRSFLRKPGPVRPLAELQMLKNNAFRLNFSLSNYPIHQNPGLLAESVVRLFMFQIINVIETLLRGVYELPGCLVIKTALFLTNNPH